MTAVGDDEALIPPVLTGLKPTLGRSMRSRPCRPHRTGRWGRGPGSCQINPMGMDVVASEADSLRSVSGSGNRSLGRVLKRVEPLQKKPAMGRTGRADGRDGVV